MTSPTLLDAHLLFPPPWSAFHSVHLSLPLLAGHLERAGLACATSDLNIRVANRLLHRAPIEATASALAAELAGQGAAGLSEEDRDAKETALAAAPLVAEEIAPALALLRDAGDGLARLPGAAQVLRLASMILLAPDLPARWDAVYGNYRPAELARDYALDVALRALERARLDAVEAALLAELDAAVTARPARLYGFGLACSEQLFPALRCARRLRERDPGARIAIGGAAVPFLERTLPLVPRFFDLVDYVVIQDGEEPLRLLLRALAGDGRVEDVPNLMRRDPASRRVVKSNESWSAGFEPPATPDFRGVDLGAYFAPATLPYLTGRRCFWNRCTFCSITYDKSTPYGPTEAGLVARQLGEIAAATGCRRFQFTDEVVAAPRVRRIADAILEQGLAVSWDALLRFDEKHTEELFARAARSGLRAAYFGFETGSQRVLDLMQKGVKLTTAERVLREAATAGVYTHCFVMLGFPGEEEADFHQTVNFCERNSGAIDSVASGHFSADLISPCGENPEAFGLGPRALPPLSLSHQLPQEDREPLMVERVVRFREATAEEPFSFLNMATLNAGNLLAFLERRGIAALRAMQRDLAREAAEARRARRLDPRAVVRLAPSARTRDAGGGQAALLDVTSGAFAVLPAPAVALAARGAPAGVLARAIGPELLASLLAQQALLPE